MTQAGHVSVGRIALWLCGVCVWVSGAIAQEPAAGLAPIAGIENLRQVTGGIFSGSQPQSEAAFKELSQRGVKVIISVDGSAPEVELAHKFGMRYVHVPIGYDQIRPQQRADLVEAVKTSDGPILMHCHHGQHRGPAAAAYCGMAVGKLTSAEALEILTAAGTKADYIGLWDAVRKFEPPQVPAGRLVETADVQPLTAAMVRMEHHWTGIDQQVKTGQVKDWQELAREALLLAEEFREAPRSSPSKDEPLNARMQTAITVTEELLKAAKVSDFKALQAANQNVLQSCIDCHSHHRDQ